MLLFAFYQKREDLVQLTEVLLILINGYADITVEEEIDFIARIDNVISPSGDGSLKDTTDTKYQPNPDSNKKMIQNIGVKYRLRSRYE